jgi:hypothetical protein
MEQWASSETDLTMFGRRTGRWTCRGKPCHAQTWKRRGEKEDNLKEARESIGEQWTGLKTSIFCLMLVMAISTAWAAALALIVQE